LPESPRDFFDAWIDVLQKYAIDEKVDFVIMCGDFFHKRNVPPETMNYAVAGLNLLKDAGIPVVAIEGNHDQKYNDSDYSWLRSLANWNLVNLLEPSNSDEGKIVYRPLEDGRGGFIDIGNVRIFGSHWYGAAANWAIPLLTEAIKETRREGAFHLLMLHTDVEGHQTHPIPALSLSALKELKSVTNYVGLGHTHMHYEIDNWAFNPGSIEVTNISEFRETRGAFVVEIGEDNVVNARHVTEYRHRPFQRLKPLVVTPFSETKQITDAVLKQVASDARSASEGEPAPIIEITLTGQLGFPNSLLEIKKMRDETQKMTGALHVRIKNHAAPIEYAVAADVEEDVGREKLERRVVEDLVTRDKRFKSNIANISQAVIGAKQQALLGEEPEKIAEFIGQMSKSKEL
jgi:DNA repair exonuclease SbcCD nuclease subunit